VEGVRKAQGRLLAWPELKRGLEAIRLAVASDDEELIRSAVKQLIPEYEWRKKPQPVLVHPVPVRTLAASGGASD
jgi:hypothetical protein